MNSYPQVFLQAVVIIKEVGSAVKSLFIARKQIEAVTITSQSAIREGTKSARSAQYYE